MDLILYTKTCHYLESLYNSLMQSQSSVEITRYLMQHMPVPLIQRMNINIKFPARPHIKSNPNINFRQI